MSADYFGIVAIAALPTSCVDVLTPREQQADQFELRRVRRSPRYLPLHDDTATVAYWYQTLPLAPYPPLPDRDAREII